MYPGARHDTVADVALASAADGALGEHGAARCVVIPSATSTRSDGIVYAEACTQLPLDATLWSRDLHSDDATPAARNCAIAPATAGVAIDVPDM